MKSLLIPIHSQVDLITNSSSEIFVSTSKSSCTVVKNLITSILALAGSTKTCDDLFIVEVAECYTDEEKYDEVYFTKSEVDELDKKGLILADDYDEDDEDNCDDRKSKGRYKKYHHEYEFEQSKIKVTALTNEGKDIAKTLSSLEKLFNIEATMNS